MLLNYLKLAIRLLIRNPFFTFINVLGLSVGFAVFFILWPFVQSELDSDKFIRDHAKISRILFDWRWTDDGGENWGRINLTVIPSFIGSELYRDAGEVYDFTRFIPHSYFSENNVGLPADLVFAIQDGNEERLFKEELVICADSNFFEFFTLPLISGKRNKVLETAESLVLSQATAVKYFGHQDPVGQIVRINGKSFHVTGVFKDIPENSHLRFNMVLSNAAKVASWNSFSDRNDSWTYTYCKTKNSNSRLTKLLSDRKDALVGSLLKQSPHIRINFITQPLDEIAFASGVGDSFEPKSKFILALLAIVSLVVLVMAWMNYINLTVSKTKTRFKEIATRKVSGAKTIDLFVQFICQSVCVNLLAVLFGVTIIQGVRQVFFDFFRIRVIDFFQIDLLTLLFFLFIFIVGTLTTALYPAWISVRYSARQLITKNSVIEKRLMPSVLTTFQYVTALVLIVWIFIVYWQLNFIMQRDIGLNKENVIIVDSPMIGKNSNFILTLSDFANRIKNISDVENATLSYAVAGDLGRINCHLKRIGGTTYFGTDSHGVTDENFIPLYHLKILAGRNFQKGERSNTIILSKYSSERLGFNSPEDAVGQHIHIDDGFENWREVEIVGIIADYRVTPFYASSNNTESISGRGECLTYLNQVYQNLQPQRISIRLNGNRFDETLSKVESIYKESFPGNIFNWYFLGEHVKKQYDQHRIIRNQLLFFTVLAIGVACLGLLGMISNKLVEKTKEIGVRKMLGAQLIHVGFILLETTSKQLLIAIGVAIPIGWYLSREYLIKFTVRVSLYWWHYSLPVAILMFIMFATIASVLWKAARTNPVDALRYE